MSNINGILDALQTQRFLEQLAQIPFTHQLVLVTEVSGDIQAPVITISTTDPTCEVFGLLRNIIQAKPVPKPPFIEAGVKSHVRQQAHGWEREK